MQRFSYVLCILVMMAAPACSQTAEHVKAAEGAQKAAYATENGCKPVADNVLGWPKDLIEYCEYKQPAKLKTNPRLPGAAYLLKVKPERLAKWIETSCDKRMPGENECFRVVLACGRWNSGYMFAVSGNIIENGKNYFFRNGMTVRMPSFQNAGSGQIPIEQQKLIALKPNESVEAIPTGLTRFWRTLPGQFTAAYPDAAVPKAVQSRSQQQQWIEFARTEMLAALQQDTNKFLDAYVNAHPVTLKGLLSKGTILEGNCPNETTRAR